MLLDHPHSHMWYGPVMPAPGTGYKSRAAAAECGLKMRPKEPGQSCAADRPGSGSGPGDSAGVTPAPPPSSSPALEPSAEAEPAPAQAPGTGQRAGSRATSGSQSGARPASQTGAKTGAQRASGRSVLDNSDAPWTRFVFQGPFGPRATDLGTGKAAGIWKTPAAYIGRRPGVSGPERAAFIRELQEGKLGPRDSGAGATGASPERSPAPSGTHSHLSILSHKPLPAVPV